MQSVAALALSAYAFRACVHYFEASYNVDEVFYMDNTFQHPTSHSR